MITLVKDNKTIDLTKATLKGDDGGYYIPSVDDEGNLTWEPSEEGMPVIEGANVKGDEGPRGESGVYVGTTEPADESLIWINPEGAANDDIATKKYVDEAIAGIEVSGGVDLSNYATKEEIPDVSNFATKDEIPSTVGLATETYVDEAIAGIEIPDLNNYYTKEETEELAAVPVATTQIAGKVKPDGTTITITGDGVISSVGGGSSSGDGGVRIVRLYSNSDKITDEDKATIYQFYTETIANGKIPNNVVFYCASPANSNVWVSITSIRCMSGGYISFQGEDCSSGSATSTYFINGTMTTTSETSLSVGISYFAPSGGDSWKYTIATGHYDLYNAKEIYILLQDSSDYKYITSYIILNEGNVLGDNTYKDYCFTTATAMDNSVPYWKFDGNEIQFYNLDSGYELINIAYKT